MTRGVGNNKTAGLESSSWGGEVVVVVAGS